MEDFRDAKSTDFLYEVECVSQSANISYDFNTWQIFVTSKPTTQTCGLLTRE